MVVYEVLVGEAGGLVIVGMLAVRRMHRQKLNVLMEMLIVSDLLGWLSALLTLVDSSGWFSARASRDGQG